MKLDKDELKNSLTLEQVFSFVSFLGGEPKKDTRKEDVFISRTICHNPVGTGSYKLYYYNNSHLFHCYTGCANSTFDIFSLLQKVKQNNNENWSLNKCINFVANYFNLINNEEDDDDFKIEKLLDWEIIKHYEETLQKNKNIALNKNATFNIINDDILKFLPKPKILPWIREGISQEIMNNRGICYNPISQGIVIPHYNDEGKLIGIRERTLIKEEEKYGKYKPAILNGVMYNHPLGFNLYNLNNSKNNIKKLGLAIIFESEKSCLKYATYFGEENDISVAICGSNLIQSQINLLLKYQVKEIVIALDRQYKQIGDDEYFQWVKKLKSFGNNYQKYAKISFIFDIESLLDYKSSPIDHGADIFLKLFINRLDCNGNKYKK